MNILSRYVMAMAMFLFLPSLALGQGAVGIRLVLPYDGTAKNFLAVELGYSTSVVDFTRDGDDLRFTVAFSGRSHPSAGSFPELRELFIPLARYVSPTELLGDRLKIIVTYPVFHERYHVIGEFDRVTNPEVRPQPAESGWWVDIVRNQRTIGRGLAIDRVGTNIGLRLLTYPFEQLDASVLQQHIDPGIWLAGTAVTSSNYVVIPMQRYIGAINLYAALFSEGELAEPAGDLILAFMSPTTAVLSAPGERARAIELAGFPRPTSRAPQSLITGKWSVLSAEDAAFGGFALTFAEPVFDPVPPSGPRPPSRWVHALSFAFGGGHAECFVGLCRIYLRFDGLDHDFLFAEIPKDGIGNRYLYRQLSNGEWQPLMVRVD